MNKTKIEWVKNPDGSQGMTWNPITGCLNGCEYCYARRLANTRLRERYLLNPRVADIEGKLHDSQSPLWDRVVTDPFYPRFWEDRMPFERSYPKDGFGKAAKGIFVCDMSDLFGIGIPIEWTERVLHAIRYFSENRFYLLTKQPQNLIKFSPFPDNCWVGVTATNQIMWNEALRYLTDVKATVKYMSIEPYLERIVPEYTLMLKSGIKQVIIGAKTKPTVYPKIEWVQEIALAATKAHIPLFLKDNLRPLLPNRMPFWGVVSWTHIDKGVPIRMSENRLRQELPKEVK